MGSSLIAFRGPFSEGGAMEAMSKNHCCLCHSNPAEGFCVCDCKELAKNAQAAPVASPANAVAVMPDFRFSVLEQALFPVIGLWNILVGLVRGISIALGCAVVLGLCTWVMPTAARKGCVVDHASASTDWSAIFLVGLLFYPLFIVLVVFLVLSIGAAIVSGDWAGSTKWEQSYDYLFSYIQPFLIPLAVTNALSLLYEIGRTKRKFAQAPIKV